MHRLADEASFIDAIIEAGPGLLLRIGRLVAGLSTGIALQLTGK